MKWYFWPVFLLLAVAVVAQQPPTLSTSDRVAINALEKAKAEASKQFQDAQQSEAEILKEWQAAHPGYHVNADNFAIERDVKQEAPKEKK